MVLLENSYVDTSSSQLAGGSETSIAATDDGDVGKCGKRVGW
jgi:hypothetical protein